MMPRSSVRVRFAPPANPRKQGGLGHGPPGQVPGSFGKRKLVHQGGRAGGVGLVVPDADNTASSETAT